MRLLSSEKINIIWLPNLICLFFRETLFRLPLCLKNEKLLLSQASAARKKFYQSLRELNFELVETIDFPDHHYYSEPELNELITKAQEKSCILITTAKDMVKIPTALRPQI